MSRRKQKEEKGGIRIRNVRQVAVSFLPASSRRSESSLHLSPVGALSIREKGTVLGTSASSGIGHEDQGPPSCQSLMVQRKPPSL